MNSPVSSAKSEGKAANPKPAEVSPARILLVDDDPVNQMVALGLLRRRGWEAIAAGNGKEALEILAQQNVNLILMDLQMPEMDGFQTATAIRRREAELSSEPSRRQIVDASLEQSQRQGGRIPIIALTTATQPGVREQCLAAGMDDYLTKPINPRALYAAVEKHLGNQQ